MEDQKLDYCEYEDGQPPPHYQYIQPQDEPRAVFVDTNLGTHLAVLISPLQTFSALKQQISLEHFNFFPKYGRIMIKDITLIINENDYIIPDTMLLKSAFQGIERPWVVCAEVWTPTGNVELPGHTEVNQVKPAIQNPKPKHVEPPSQYHHDPKLLMSSPQNYIVRHVEPSSMYHHEPKHYDLSYQNHILRHEDPFPQHHLEPRHLIPSHQIHKRPSSQNSHKHPVKPSPQIQGTPNINEQKKKKNKKSKSKSKKNTAIVDGKTNDRSQDSKIVGKQLDEKTEKQGQSAVSNAGKATYTKHLSKPGEGHHDISVMLMEVDSDNNVTDLKDNSPNLAGNVNKESGILNFESPPGPQANKSKRKKKSGIDGATQTATPVKGPAILEMGDAPSKNDTTTHTSEKTVIETGGEVSQEPMSQQVRSNFENTSKKRRATEIEQESKNSAEKILPSNINNVPEPMSQDENQESRKTTESVKDIAEAPTAKKRKTSKAKSSSTENQDLSSRRPNDDEKADGTKNLHGELSQPDAVGKPDESVETMSVKVKKSRSRKAVPEDPPGSHVKERPVEEIKEMATPIAVFQSDKSKRKSQKKQPLPTEDLSSVVENQHATDGMMEEGVPVKVDDASIKCDANDALLKSENTCKILKTDNNDRECRTADAVSSSHLRDVSKVVLSQDESLNLAEKEKEIKEDVAPSKSENTAKKRKNKAKSCGTENQEWSCRKQNEDEKTDDGGKVPGANLATGMDASKRADDLLTDSKSNDTQNQNAMKQGEEHAEFSQNPGLESSVVVNEMPQLEKPLASKKKTKKTDQASSIDTSSNARNLDGSKKNQGSAKTSELQISNTVQKQDFSTPKQVVDSDRSKSSKVRKIYREEEAEKPRNNVEEGSTSLRRSSRVISKEVLKTSEKKNGRLASSRAIFEDGNSSSSGDQNGSYSSSSSATIAPDDSDDSDFDSGDVMKSNGGSLKGNGSIKAESSGLNLESILKSSSRYKKAKLVASQSQGESEPPEFVPDSQAYM